MSNPIRDIMDNSMDKIKAVADANTVLGDPVVTADGTTVIPVSRVKFSFAGGGSEFTTKSSAGGDKPYGGGTGGSTTVTPVAFLISKEGSCRVLPVPVPADNTVDRLIELLPEVVEKVDSYLKQKKAEKG